MELCRVAVPSWNTVTIYVTRGQKDPESCIANPFSRTTEMSF